MEIKENVIYNVKDAFTNEETTIWFEPTEENNVWLVHDKEWGEYILDDEEITDCFIFE